jgi:ferredoxin
LTNSDEAPLDGPSVDWPLRTDNKVRSGLRFLERWTLKAERPVGKAVGTPRLNPLYHTGTISVFLFVVVFFTGVYLTAFYQYGFTDSYKAITAIEANLVGRLVRAVHRYASVALVVTSLLHGWRTFFQDRFRQARWVAWVSGVAMMLLLWIIGVTGYWLIWDERAEVINRVFIRTIDGFTLGLDFVLDNIVSPVAGSGWPFLLLIFLIHFLLSMLVGFLIWVHLKRLSRAKLMPPRYWVLLIGGAIVLASIIWPAGLLPAFNPNQLPGTFPVDPFYLFLMPLGLQWSPGWLWTGVVVVSALVTGIPWLLRRKPLDPIRVHADRCTGCTLCVVDCPYKALEMIPRDDDTKYRQLAVVHDEMCVACGVCIGSCPTEALTLGDEPADALWDEVRRLAEQGDGSRIVLTCERHALQGAAGHMGEGGLDLDGRIGHVVPVPCVGMIHPGLVGAALDAGAGDVQVIGCPPADCANREGNSWLQARLDRERVPRLKSEYVDAPITTDWVAPDSFDEAVANPGSQPVADPEEKPSRRRQIPVLILVTLVTLVSIALTNIKFTPATAGDTVIALAVDHQGGAKLLGFKDMEPALDKGTPPRLLVEVDGQPVLDKTYNVVSADGGPTSLGYDLIPVEPGQREVKVTLFDRVDRPDGFVVFDDRVGLDVGEIFNIALNDEAVATEADAGRSLFMENTFGTNTGCRLCHSLEPDVVLVGPSLAGVATRAETRVPGLSAEEYLHQSIVDPNAYVVEGFPKGQMFQNFAEVLTEEQIDSLVAFLLTLK